MTIIFVAAIGVAVNGATALLFLSGRKGDLNIRAAFMHMAADAMVAMGVVAGGATILWTGWLWVDPALSLVLAAVIVAGTWSLLRDSLNRALHAVPEGIDQQAVRAYLASLPGVTEVHDLHIWAMSTTETALTVHLVRPGSGRNDRLLQRSVRAISRRDHRRHAAQLAGDANRACLC